MSDVLGDDVPESTGDELKIKAPSIPAENSSLQGVDTETWKDVYVDFAEQDPHIACWDCFTGQGGFLGNVDVEGAYSYIIAKITENFYKTRVKLTIFFNLMAPYVNSKVKPIFALDVKDSVRVNDTLKEKDEWLDHVDDATGTGISLNAIREDSSIKSNVLDVSYIVMDKVDGKVIEYVKSTLDVVSYEVDSRTKKLTSIKFWEPSIVVDDKVTFVQFEWKLENGKNVLVEWRGKADRRCVDGAKMEIHATTETGIDVLNVYAQFAETSEAGNYKPHRPKSYSIARICASLYNSFSLLNYLMFKQGHGLYVFQGDIQGLRDALSNVAIVPANEPNGRSYQMPQILTPDPDMPRVHIEIIKEYIGFAMAMMSNNGVSVQKSAAESGLSKTLDLVADISEYNRTSEMNKRTDRWRKKTFNLFMARSDDKYKYLTEYPTEFTSVNDINSEELMDIADKYLQIGMTKAAEHLYKTVIGMTTKDLSLDDRNDIKEDIEKLMKSIKRDSPPIPKTPPVDKAE